MRRPMPEANRPDGWFQTSSMGVLSDVQTGRSFSYARKKRINPFASRILRNKRLSKPKIKRIQTAALVSLMLAAFSLFSICFGDTVFSMDEQEIPVSEYLSARAEVWLLEAAENAVGESALYLDATQFPEEIAPQPEIAIHAESAISSEEIIVYYSQSGSRYHIIPTCSGMKEAIEAELSQAKALGKTACKRCNPPE